MTTLSEISIPTPEDLFYKGRAGDPRLGERFISSDPLPPLSDAQFGFAIFGSPDDLGVRMNRGRAGARGGPDSIRRHLYKMAPPMDHDWPPSIRMIDLGNVRVSTEITETHARTRELAELVAKAGYVSISLGGGHDFAAPSFAGFSTGLGKKNRGLINVDPHLDVRELDNGLPHSGTPFRQLLDERILDGKSLIEFGAQPNRNSRAHYEYCRAHKVQILDFPELRNSGGLISDRYNQALKSLTSTLDVVGATFDMDSCCECEGTSAAPVLGFTAAELITMSRIAGEFTNVRHFEIAEVAPELDVSERSSRIAAEMLYAFISARITAWTAKSKKGQG